jgi:Cutinase
MEEIVKAQVSTGGYGIELTDANGAPQREFEVGDGLLLQAPGLKPNSPHRITVTDDKDQKVLAISLASDRFGTLGPCVVWPDIGIGLPEKGGPHAFDTEERAHAAMRGRRFAIEVAEGHANIRKGTFHIAKTLQRPRLHSATESGALRRGLLLGEDGLRVRGHRLPAGSIVDLYLVKSRHDWRPGDTFAPVRNPNGREVTQRVQLEREETGFEVMLWPRDQVRTGRYDIIARIVVPHEYRAEEPILRRTDIVSDKRITSVVIRDDIFRYKPIHLGCVMAMREMAGKKLVGSPYFEFTNNFPRGTDVWATLDPAGLMPSAIGKKVRYYTIAHKTAAQWAVDSSLVDVTGNVTEIVTTSSCINGNEALVWPNPQVAGKYDLIADFGNNAPNPMNFVPDNSFDPPLDMIDGYLNIGFYVTDDPSVAGSFAIGQTAFNSPAVDIPAAGVWSPWGTLGNTMSGTLSLPLVAEVRYPADVNGMDVSVSAVKPTYPVVVIMHGMHSSVTPSYQGYNYLLDHLASNGFIAVSIDCNAINAIGGMQDTRGQAILAHLTLLQSTNANPGIFQGKIDMTKIGIMGHSRGGDGVVQAEILNQSQGLGWNIKAIVALAPTDFSGISPAPMNLATSKFLCVYGSNDGDVWGGSTPATDYAGTGFRFYDRATVEKAVAFIYGATHNRFNTQWGTEGKVDAASAKVVSDVQHQTLLKGYMTAFLQIHLQGRTEQLDYFKGELKIPQASSVEVFTQYRPTVTMTLDDFETKPALNQNSLGGTVAFANLDGPPEENPAATIDVHSPHQTRGLRLKWNNTTAKYDSQIPLLGSARDLSGWNFLSFRVSQKVLSGANPGDQLQDLYVRLTTAGGGNSRAIRAGYFRTIPFPYKPAYSMAFVADEDPNTKAAMNTVRIPLFAWTVKALSAPIVDLTNVESLTFEFSAKATGELEIDDIDFAA